MTSRSLRHVLAFQKSLPTRLLVTTDGFFRVYSGLALALGDAMSREAARGLRHHHSGTRLTNDEESTARNGIAIGLKDL